MSASVSLTASPVCSASQMFIHTARARVAGGDGATAVQGAELGLFDAFFASLSMILVSEVRFLSPDFRLRDASVC